MCDFSHDSFNTAMHFHAAVLALGVHGVSRVSPALSRPSRLLLHKCTSLWLYRAWHSFFCFLVLIGIFFSSAEPAAVELGSEHPSPAQFSRSLTSGSVEVPSGAVGTQAEGTYAAGPSLAQAPPTSVEHVSAQGSGPDLRMGDTQNRGYGSALGRSQYRRDGMFVSDEVIEEHSVTRKHVVPTVRKPLPE